MHSDLSYDLDYVISNDFDRSDTSKLHKNSKAIKAIKIIQLGLQDLKKKDDELTK